MLASCPQCQDWPVSRAALLSDVAWLSAWLSGTWLAVVASPVPMAFEGNWPGLHFCGSRGCLAWPEHGRWPAVDKTPQHVQLAAPPGSLPGPLLLSSSWTCLTSFQQETVTSASLSSLDVAGSWGLSRDWLSLGRGQAACPGLAREAREPCHSGRCARKG